MLTATYHSSRETPSRDRHVQGDNQRLFQAMPRRTLNTSLSLSEDVEFHQFWYANMNAGPAATAVNAINISSSSESSMPAICKQIKKNKKI